MIKNIIIASLSACAIGFAIWGFKQKDQKETAQVKTASQEKVVKQAATIINTYIDKNNLNHSVISADSNRLSANWYDNGTAISGGLVDTVAQALGIAKKQLQEAVQISTTTEAAKLKAEKKIDSLQRLTYYYRDKYLQLAYRPAKPGDTTDNGQFDFKYNDSLNVVQYWKRSWFLGAKKNYIDIFSNDPRTTVNGIKRLVVEQKEPSFGLRVQAIANYNFSKQVVNVGPGLQFDFKRLSLLGTYYYDFDGQAFRPTFAARYDLIKL